MAVNNQKRKIHLLLTIGYCFVALLLPNIFLFVLYNNNIEEGIHFEHVLILAVILAVIGLLLFFVFRYVTKGMENALILSLLFWLGFWFFGAIARIVPLPSLILTILLCVVIIVITIILRRYQPPFHKISPVFNMFAIGIVILFVFNIMPGIQQELTLRRGRIAMADLDEYDIPFYIKRDFIVDPSLLSPDIYWFHLDGIMSLEQMERFWGMNKDGLRHELTARGFLIYEDAFLYGSPTRVTMPALLSPAFYDSYFHQLMYIHREVAVEDRLWTFINSLATVGLSLYDDIFPYVEFLSALALAGYDLSISRSGDSPNAAWVHSIARLQEGHDGYIFFAMSRWDRFLLSLGYLPELLTMTTPLNIQPPLERAHYVPNHGDSDLPRFNLKTFLYPHANMWWLQCPDSVQLDATHPRRLYLYHLAVEYTMQLALDYIDEILERNPNAVIVLQADHGFHIAGTHQYLIDEGVSLEERLRLTFSVLSAVRIPPQYGGLDAPLAPLNITRELVNRFVGENYTLLPN